MLDLRFRARFALALLNDRWAPSSHFSEIRKENMTTPIAKFIHRPSIDPATLVSGNQRLLGRRS